MSANALHALSPVDGRYKERCRSLSPYFSEYGLMRYRVQVEIEYLIALGTLSLPQVLPFTNKQTLGLRGVYKNFSIEDGRQIKEIEKETNHDVKAVEYFVKNKLNDLDLSYMREFVHFGLTSQDINNTAIPLSMKDACQQVIIPELDQLINQLLELEHQWKAIPMLAHTHGQPASPTRLGKEIGVFSERIRGQLELLNEIPHSAKFGGATGNFNAHYAAYPLIDWQDFAFRFLKDVFDLDRSYPTTQIEHYDNLAAFLDSFKRIGNVLIDLSRDIWLYVSMGYFNQKIAKNEVGSSAMPHKVNPIDFENAEGNLGVGNALFTHLAGKLPVSRLQRDLTDSTVLRNLGVPFAHFLIAISSIKKGLSKLELNEKVIHSDLEKNWVVVAEGIQNILRREGFENPYETLKTLTRTNDAINKKTIHSFIDGLEISDVVKKELKALSPFNYLGK